MAVKTKKNKVNPLHWKVPIVSPNGTPTPEFMQKWTQQAATNAAVPDLTTQAALSALLDTLGLAQGDIIYRDAALWKVLTPGTLGYVLQTGGAAANPSWAAASTVLDRIGTTQGNVLYRSGAVWAVLAPGTDGQLLSYDATAHAPKWSSIAGVLLGSGAPATVQPAGTLYSRTDTAGVYSSQPILNAPVIVQSSKQDNNGAGAPKSITFSGAVTAGNLLIAILSESTTGTPGTAAAGWTMQAMVADGTNSYMAIYTRTAVGGDGTAPPAVVTTNAGLASGWLNYEISGTSWASLDGAIISAGIATPGATTVMTAYTPSVAQDLVLTAVADFKATFAAQPTIGAPFTVDQQGAFFRMAGWAGHDISPPSGTPIAATITWGASSTTGDYMVFGLKGTAFTQNWVFIGPTPSTTPTVQTLTGGTTYTPTAGTKWIEVQMVGGGGGSAGSGTGLIPAGGTGGTTSFNGATAVGGGGAPGNAANGTGGTGGVNNSIPGVFRSAGADGFNGANVWVAGAGQLGGNGGNSLLGGGASQNAAGTGKGGGAGGASVGTTSSTTAFSSGGGGGAGEYARFMLPAASYTYAIGAAGAAPGSSQAAPANAGSAGAPGVIVVTEHYS